MASHSPVQVFIAAQAALYRAAWAALLADQPNINVAGAVDSEAGVTAYLGSQSSITLPIDFPPPLFPVIQQSHTNYPDLGLLALVDAYDLLASACSILSRLERSGKPYRRVRIGPISSIEPPPSIRCYAYIAIPYVSRY